MNQAVHPGTPNVSALSEQTAHWQRRLDELATKHGVPGAQLAILRRHEDRADELVQVSFGVLNLDTGVEVTNDSVFQIGSISKVWTATVIMGLVDEGLLDLDTPIIDILPELRLADPDTNKQVTVRHLLTHTSGIDGDLFTDVSRGDDVLERYVELLADVEQIFPLGQAWSYCNAGFILLGRVIEKVTGSVWDEALRSRLIQPLDLPHTVTLPEEALLHRAAVGHIDGPDGKQIRIPVWNVPRSAGPAGGIMATATDVLAFARMHLSDGLAADGSLVLRPETVRLMQAQHAELPEGATGGDMTGSSWGLGWMRMNWEGQPLVGHNGGTTGQAAALRLLPSQGIATVLLTNGGQHDEVNDELIAEVFAEVAGLAQPRWETEPPAVPGQFDAASYAGKYANLTYQVEIVAADAAFLLRLGEVEEDGKPGTAIDIPLIAASEDVLVMNLPPERRYQSISFLTLDSGTRYLCLSGRLLAKRD